MREMPRRWGTPAPTETDAVMVTLRTRGRVFRFGRVQRGYAVLSEAGELVLATWRSLRHHFPGLELDELAILPNHVHGLIRLHGPARASRRAQLTLALRALQTQVEEAILTAQGPESEPVWDALAEVQELSGERDEAAARQRLRTEAERWADDPDNPHAEIALRAQALR